MEDQRKEVQGNEGTLTYEEAVEIGVKTALDFISERRREETKKKSDRRLRNTQLLLRNYRSFVAHCSFSEQTRNEITAEQAMDVLDDLDLIENETTYVQAIVRTKTRTIIIMEHINRVIKYYRVICEGENRLRRYSIIEKLYIKPLSEGEKPPRYEDVATEMQLNEKTVRRNVYAAIDDLSVLLFGIDGVKL